MKTAISWIVLRLRQTYYHKTTLASRDDFVEDFSTEEETEDQEEEEDPKKLWEVEDILDCCCVDDGTIAEPIKRVCTKSDGNHSQSIFVFANDAPTLATTFSFRFDKIDAWTQTDVSNLYILAYGENTTENTTLKV